MKIKTYIFFCCCIFLLPSCEVDELFDKDHLFENELPKDGIFVYNCSSYTKWHFFSFEQGDVIGSCDAEDTIAYQSWYNRTDWDLAFHRQNIKCNGGISGIGNGGIYPYPQQTFDFEAVKIAPDDGYIVDVRDSIVYDMDKMMEGLVGYIYTGTNPALKQWAVLVDMMNSTWVIAQQVFIVRTAQGNYAKIYLRNFKNDIGVSGTITMQYVYQADGTVILSEE